MSQEDINEILAHGRITPLFQPIVSRKSQIFGYEALSRGPSGSPLSSPMTLFEAARNSGQLLAMEKLAWFRAIEQFFSMDLPGKLFLNTHPECMLEGVPEAIENALKQYGGEPGRVVMEITEAQPISNKTELLKTINQLRQSGFSIAIDDFGAGHSGLRQWSELLPDIVKIDRYFIENIHQDGIKRQFVNSIMDMARTAGATVLAEGIELLEEHQTILSLGVELEQGFFFERPSQYPAKELHPSIKMVVAESQGSDGGISAKVKSLATAIPSVASDTKVRNVARIFIQNANLRSIPVVNGKEPKGLVHRHQFMTMYASMYGDALWGKSPISTFTNTDVAIVKGDMSVEHFSQKVTEDSKISSDDGFIVVDSENHYLGVGTFMDLLRKITELQIQNARYANPLTQLPGNVPIVAHIDHLLQSEALFAVAYCDLDNFKAFNDTYGFAKGDELIVMLAKLLMESALSDHDFVGHVGGDDFIVVFQSENWEERCNMVLHKFAEQVSGLYESHHLQNGGFYAKDRKGNEVFFSIASLSVGVVPCPQGRFSTHHEVSVAASEIKHQAKKIEGNSLFVDRRVD